MSVIQPIEKTEGVIIPEYLRGTRTAIFFLIREAEIPPEPRPPTKNDGITFMAKAAFVDMQTVRFVPSEQRRSSQPPPVFLPLDIDEFLFSPSILT